MNHLSRVTVGASAVHVRYVLDLAEIPTLQEAQSGGIAGIAERLAGGLSLAMDDQPAALSLRSSSVEQLAGQAGLTTLRVTLDLEARGARDGARVAYVDGTYAGRIGWHAVMIDGTVRDPSAPSDDPDRSWEEGTMSTAKSPLSEIISVADLAWQERRVRYFHENIEKWLAG